MPLQFNNFAAADAANASTPEPSIYRLGAQAHAVGAITSELLTHLDAVETLFGASVADTLRRSVRQLDDVRHDIGQLARRVQEEYGIEVAGIGAALHQQQMAAAELRPVLQQAVVETFRRFDRAHKPVPQWAFTLHDLVGDGS